MFIHGQEILHVSLPFYRQPHLHDLLHFIYHKIPPFTGLTAMISRLPNERHNPWASLGGAARGHPVAAGSPDEDGAEIRFAQLNWQRGFFGSSPVPIW